jgi:hypothetical protein
MTCKHKSTIRFSNPPTPHHHSSKKNRCVLCEVPPKSGKQGCHHVFFCIFVLKTEGPISTQQLHCVKPSLRIFLYHRGTAPYAVGEDAVGFLYSVQKKEGIFRMQNSAALSQSLYSLRIFLYHRTGGGTAPYAVGEDARIPLHCSKEVKEFRMQNSAAMRPTLFP